MLGHHEACILESSGNYAVSKFSNMMIAGVPRIVCYHADNGLKGQGSSPSRKSKFTKPRYQRWTPAASVLRLQ
jgi:hypothetical protein